MSQKLQDQTPGNEPARGPERTSKPESAEQPPVQGEGDYEAARRYREELSDFLSRSDVEEIAQRAAPKSALEARELAIAAERGRERSKGDDPADVGAMYPGRQDGKP